MFYGVSGFTQQASSDLGLKSGTECACSRVCTVQRHMAQHRGSVMEVQGHPRIQDIAAFM